MATSSALALYFVPPSSTQTRYFSANYYNIKHSYSVYTLFGIYI